MDIKQKFNTKFKSLVKVPSKLSANLSASELQFKPPNFRPQINSLFNPNQEAKSGLADLNKNALSPEQIRYIQEKHLPVVMQYTKQKELREMQINPYLTNPKLEQEIINSIEQLYYSDLIEQTGEDEQPEKRANEDETDLGLDGSIEASMGEQSAASTTDRFDPFEHILNKLPDTMDLGFILEEKKKLNKQLMVVTKRVSDLIQQNQSTYNKELASVIELQEILIDAINICSSGRGRLDAAKKNLTRPNLTLLSNYRRREVMIELLNEFFTIKTLLQTELTLNDLIMEEEDYAVAIKLCLECLKIIGSLNRYKCLTDLGVKLNCTIEMTEERLDLALAGLCDNFNANQFGKIRKTFNLLGKTHFPYDQLLIHFSSVINKKTLKIVNNYVKLCVVSLNDSLASSKQAAKERSFEEVCGQLSSDCFLPCLRDFNKSMWHLMVNYRRFISAHDAVLQQSGDDRDDKETSSGSSNPDHSNPDNGESNSQPDSQGDEPELDCDLTLIRQKLKFGLTKIWQEIENKLAVLIRNHNLSIYSFDDFISMINIVRRMMRVGCEFSGTEKSDQLEEALRKAASEYFYVFHKTKMEEIKVYLETELWELVPMKPDFSIEQLHEFNFLKNGNHLKISDESKDREEESNFFGQIDSKQTPFDGFMKKSERTEEMSIESETDREPKQDPCSNETRPTVSSEPDRPPVIVTASSLNILRILGKYMQIMIIHNQISFDVLLCIFHLFDYYLYGVHVFFAGAEATDADRSPFGQPSTSLANLLRRIESTLIISKSAKSDARMKFHPPELSNAVNLNDKDHLFGLLKRAIGVESLVFLASQFDKIFDPLSSLINEKKWLEQFFKQTVNVSVELREPVYMHVAARYIQHEQVVQSMERVNWEVKEIMSQHNLYVDQLIQDLYLFRLKETDLIQFARALSNESAGQILWNQVLKLVNFIFIDGFSTAKKCTPEGRALMQLDYQQFLCKIENVVSIKPIPNKELVDEYIKAYYYTEDQLSELVKSRRDYSVKQLRSLVSCTLNDNKKARQRLLALIESEFASK